MERNDISDLAPNIIYKKLAAVIMADAEEGKKLLERMMKEERFHNDYEFRLIVETSETLLHYVKGEYLKVLSGAVEKIERAKSLKLWRMVAVNQNVMGVAYQALEIFEKALECFWEVIQTENDHGMRDISSIAYNNISIIYANLNAYDKAYENLLLAIKIIEEEKETLIDYDSRILTYKSNLIVELCLTERVEEIGELYEQIESLSKEDLSTDAIFSFYSAKMYYAFSMGQYEEGRKAFRYIFNDLSISNKYWMITALGGYFLLCEKFHMPYDFYLEEIHVAECLLEQETDEDIELSIFGSLRKYYEESGEREKYREITCRYVGALERSNSTMETRRVDSLLTVEKLIEERRRLGQIADKNDELRMVADEALKHKKALQEVYQRLELINELGRRMTSSLNLSNVIDMIYNNICENLPVDSFFLVVAEPEKNRLRSLAYYRLGVLQPEAVLSLDDPDSMFVECYQTKQSILSEDIYSDPRFADRNLIHVGVHEVKSVIFTPMRVEDQLVGVCSVQSRHKGSYTRDHLIFLESLLPYLSIALNNAVYSGKLEREIKSHLRTQEQLKKANKRLSELSSLDGLTQISNRRDFESRVLELLEKAGNVRQPVAVFMFDIDNFKRYNDTYGHLVGDEALKAVANVIRKNLDAADGLSARFGGEEFIGASAGLDLKKAEALGNKICSDVFSLGIANKGVPLGILTISVGISYVATGSAKKKSVLMKVADDSLYEAKNSGKNRVILTEIEP